MFRMLVCPMDVEISFLRLQRMCTACVQHVLEAPPLLRWSFCSFRNRLRGLSCLPSSKYSTHVPHASPPYDYRHMPTHASSRFVGQYIVVSLTRFDRHTGCSNHTCGLHSDKHRYEAIDVISILVDRTKDSSADSHSVWPKEERTWNINLSALDSRARVFCDVSTVRRFLSPEERQEHSQTVCLFDRSRETNMGLYDLNFWKDKHRQKRLRNTPILA